MFDWSECKNILCIRADNMGDLIMTTPALRALKETFNCNITVLTSQMGSVITPFIKEIDEVIVHDLPWIKTVEPVKINALFSLVEELQQHYFDAVIIFTVYSQNPLPAATLSFLCNIPKRLAYCRENPYQLLTNWIPEKEPFRFIQHQVKRDLNLVAEVGAVTSNDYLSLSISDKAYKTALEKIASHTTAEDNEWVIFHPGVSEEKRMYPIHLWIQLGKSLTSTLRKKILITGSASEMHLIETIKRGIGEDAYACAGLFSIEEFIAAIKLARLVITVNTATVHIAAATKTSVIVLYALTNPQHTPWKVQSKVFPFQVEEHLKSRNEVINYVNSCFFNKQIPFPSTEDITYAAVEILQSSKVYEAEEPTDILVL